MIRCTYGHIWDKLVATFCFYSSPDSFFALGHLDFDVDIWAWEDGRWLGGNRGDVRARFGVVDGMVPRH